MNISKIQILGPFNSGTNLITKILNKNIQQDIILHKEGHTLIWKHSLNKNNIEKLIKLNTDTLFICIYKPLHNWISSMQKHSYDIKWDNTLTEKCRFLGRKYNNIIEIYNEYYNMYMEFINNYKTVICVNYYDILNKNNVVEYLSNKLFLYNLSIKSDHTIIYILDKPSKNHGKSVKSSYDAISKKDKSYNDINNYKNNISIIKQYFNYKIIKYFEQ